MMIFDHLSLFFSLSLLRWTPKTRLLMYPHRLHRKVRENSQVLFQLMIPRLLHSLWRLILCLPILYRPHPHYLLRHRVPEMCKHQIPLLLCLFHHVCRLYYQCHHQQVNMWISIGMMKIIELTLPGIVQREREKQS